MKVSNHAIERFRERTGCKKDKEYVQHKLLEILDKSQKAEFKHPKYNVYALLNHNFQEAEYYLYHTFLLVVVGDEIRTVHGNEANRWRPVDYEDRP